MSRVKHIAIIGGGPAGLRAAECASAAGARVTVFDSRRSVGRKFLLAGKRGLNLTNAASFEDFLAVYRGHELPAATWRACLAAFDRDATREWAARLGIDSFAASSGKIFPVGMKAAPLLRRWVQHLRAAGVTFAMNHRWTGLHPGQPIEARFEVPGPGHAPREIRRPFDSIVLALGGASWPDTGSDARWVPILVNHGIIVRPLAPANCGWECPWTPATRARVEGKPLQNIHARAGDALAIGEAMLTWYGIQGTVVYALGPVLRDMSGAEIRLDLKPSFSEGDLLRKMQGVHWNLLAEAGIRLRLPDAAQALLEQFHGPFEDVPALIRAVKDCRLPLTAPRPIAEAISTAGGVAWSELDENLMLRKLPGVFCAGEMIDWEAPTGGFLLQGCLATGTRAGTAAGQGSV